MKRNNMTNLFGIVSFVCFILFTTGCSTEQEYEVTDQEPEEVIDGEERGLQTVPEDPLGGRPSQSEVLARGVWRSGYVNCTDGFGMCDIQIAASTEDFEENIPDYAEEEGVNIIPATFVLDTEDKNSMRIQFLQRVPHFQQEFVVHPLSRGFANIFGADSVYVEGGTYSADTDYGDFGTVQVRIRRVGAQQIN